MKFYDTHFEDYLNSHQTLSLHPKLDKMYQTILPATLKEFTNLIFYGPKGVGKYTQMLCAIKKYSPSGLKYEKKISVTYNKSLYFYKISDIHFEIDMSLLGCNSKILWNEVFTQIVDIILAKAGNTGIIVCKYFHEIHSELLDSFYSYMQTSIVNTVVKIKFILITEELSFIPTNILNCCYVISVPRPSRALYNKCLTNKPDQDLLLHDITNIKNILSSVKQLMHPYEVICNKVLNDILNVEEMRFLSLRDNLYNIFIYNLDVTDCIWYILDKLLRAKKIQTATAMSAVLIKTYSFLQYYNNNYRPIYHLESYIFFLIKQVHGY